jgi:hypothetical protein
MSPKKNGRSFSIVNPAGITRNRVFECIPKLWFVLDAAFATLAAMFIHRTTITGLSDRGAWPWRKPDCVRT